jgi:hypothetical protein
VTASLMFQAERHHLARNACSTAWRRRPGASFCEVVSERGVNHVGRDQLARLAVGSPASQAGTSTGPLSTWRAINARTTECRRIVGYWR